MNTIQNFKNLNNNWYIIIKRNNQDFLVFGGIPGARLGFGNQYS